MTEAAPQVVIRRCVLRIARRGGWSWGPDPARVKRAAVERLPALLARRVAYLTSAASGEDIELTAPIVLRVPIRAREWMELVNTSDVDRPSAVLDAALARALDLPSAAASLGVKSARPSASAAPPTGMAQDESSSASSASAPSALLALLLRWREEGSLAHELAMLDADVLATWLGRLVGAATESNVVAAIEEATVEEVGARVDAIKLPMPRGAARERARELLFVVEFSATRGTDVATARAALGLFRKASLTEGIADIGGTRSVASGRASTRPRESFEIDVPCASPFLILGPLERAGYFVRLAAMLDAARAGVHAHGFAYALARKVLAPPARGWLRTAGDIAAAAALAGRVECDEESIVNVAHALRPQLTVLDGSIFDALQIPPVMRRWERCEEVLSGLSALRDQRPVLRPHVNEAFEDTLTLGAAYALGLIAQTLWSPREQTTPTMALERFADFDARVHVTREEIHVALPLGRRFWDLRDHGLLADVHGLPWLPEARVTFGTG